MGWCWVAGGGDCAASYSQIVAFPPFAFLCLSSGFHSNSSSQASCISLSGLDVMTQPRVKVAAWV